MPDGTVVRHRDLIIALVARYRLPAVYPFDFFVPAVALFPMELIRSRCLQTVNYVDRVLRGAKPADLPVQVPTKYETAINLKTAVALASQCRTRFWSQPTS